MLVFDKISLRCVVPPTEDCAVPTTERPQEDDEPQQRGQVSRAINHRLFKFMTLNNNLIIVFVFLA